MISNEEEARLARRDLGLAALFFAGERQTLIQAAIDAPDAETSWQAILQIRALDSVVKNLNSSVETIDIAEAVKEAENARD